MINSIGDAELAPNILDQIPKSERIEDMHGHGGKRSGDPF